jgi:hypothetical protein
MLKSWQSSGVRPPCQYHHHMSYKKAFAHVQADEAFFVTELRAIVPYTSVLFYVWQGRRSGGYSTMQLCSIQGRKPPTPLCEAARKA